MAALRHHRSRTLKAHSSVIQVLVKEMRIVSRSSGITLDMERIRKVSGLLRLLVGEGLRLTRLLASKTKPPSLDEVGSRKR